MQNALAAINPDQLIEQVANGAFLKDLSAQTGIDKRRLSELLRKHPDYTAAKESAIEVQLDDAQVAILSADEATDIARAREQFKAAAWRAEREFPHRWGNKQQVELSGAVTVDNVAKTDLLTLVVKADATQQSEITDVEQDESGVSD